MNIRTYKYFQINKTIKHKSSKYQSKLVITKQRPPKMGKVKKHIEIRKIKKAKVEQAPR